MMFSRPHLIILANLLEACDVDVLHENVASDHLVDLTPQMLGQRCDAMARIIREAIAQPDGDLNDENQVLVTLLEFHAGNDEPNEYYPDEPFKRLCKKFGVTVPA